MSDNQERKIVIRPEDLARAPTPRPTPLAPPPVVLPHPPLPAPSSRRWVLPVVAAISGIVLAGVLAIVWVVVHDDKNGIGGKSSGAINIERVLKADATTTTGATSVADVVGRMRAISLTGCPQDFSAAYVAHIHAWELLEDFERDAIAFDANFNSGAALLDLKQAYILRIFVPGRDFERGRTVHGQPARTAGEELFGVVHGRGPFLRVSP